MENQMKTLKKKHLDSFDRVDAKRFCKSDGNRHDFSIIGTFSSTGIPLQANSTSFLIFTKVEYRWIASSNATHTSKIDFSQYASLRLKGDGSKGKQNVLQIFGVKARTGETQGFYSLAQGLCISDDGKPVLLDGWNNHLLKVKKNIPVSSMEKWKPTTSSSCNANVPAEVELKGKGKKRAAPASATPSLDEKKQDIGYPSSSSPMETTVIPIPLQTPIVKRKNDDREIEGVSEEPASKKVDDGKCSCSGCKSSRYVSLSFLIVSGD
jgi:hypothetical protein